MKTLFRAVCLLLFVLLYTGCTRAPLNYYQPGVSIELAEYRSSSISNISYYLTFKIPADKTESVSAEELIRFDIKKSKHALLIDFRGTRQSVDSLLLNGKGISVSYLNDHIVIPKSALNSGTNELYISFTAGDMSLNRNSEFIYTLFVPDRASSAFPCFDQPDLKANFNLTLKIDTAWTAIANNPLVSENSENQWKTMKFAEGKPISTYLFAFAAGNFKEIVRSVDGITMQMLHRETDNQLIDSNIDEIFKLHAKSIRWLEEYTGISYPFDKFGFVMIPSFQYGGMEHPGSIYYRANSLLLEKNSSINQELSRAGLIAHETAHIWFGDLVTMEWFNDVWLKEVFAGFMSDKITNPSFPEVNHELRFLFGRYPAAYEVDRTTGSNPIIQDLQNMRDAGSLYGAIIYNKAPIVMKHLEMILGEDLLRDGLREYLNIHSYSNAKWDDLVVILDKLVDSDIKTWSDVWVKEPGMPHLSSIYNPAKGKESISFSELDPENKDRHWPQLLKTLIIYPDSYDTIIIEPEGRETVLVNNKISAYIPGFDGLTYGFIEMSSENIFGLLNSLQDIESPLVRGTVWLNSWENMVAGVVDPVEFIKVLLDQIPRESELLILARLRGYLNDIYWHYIDSETRIIYSELIENLTLDMLRNEESLSEKRAWFSTFQSLATSENSMELIYSLWNGDSQLRGLELSENDYISISYNLALKQYDGFENILKAQSDRILNIDRKQEYAFIIQALDSSELGRDAFFNSLKGEVNRQHEPWVTKALGYLHHPLNAEQSVKYIPESLELLSEIQATGDIFFPGQWISTTLSGHHSYEAFEMVNDFLLKNPDYPRSLRLKILQAYDHLYREYGK